MRLIMWNKAEKLKDKVIFEGECRGKSFFKVGDYNVVIAYNGKYTYLGSCTCTHHSIFGGTTDMKMLCAYVLAVYKFIQNGNNKRENKRRTFRKETQ